jgi:hypothetical protein
MELIRYGQEVRTIFDLFGSKENDMTFSLGWVLSRSEAFLRFLIADVCGSVPSHLRQAIIKLQTGRGIDEITDIEIEVSNELVFVIEAKRGPQLPTARQLAKYANFLSGSAAKNKHLLALTNASAASAGSRLELRRHRKDSLASSLLVADTSAGGERVAVLGIECEQTMASNILRLRRRIT